LLRGAVLDTPNCRRFFQESASECLSQKGVKVNGRQSLRLSTAELRLLDAICVRMSARSRSHGLVRCLIHTGMSIGGLRQLVDAALSADGRVRRRTSRPIRNRKGIQALIDATS